MGNGASSDGRAESQRPISRPHSAAAGGGAPPKRQVLANQSRRRSANSFRSPAATQEAAASRQNAARSAEAKSAALQRVAARRCAAANPTEENAIRAFTRNADPTSLRVLQLIQQADNVPSSNPAEKLRLLRQCYPLLEEVPKERFDQLAVTVYQQEGDIYYQQMDIQNAKDTFSRAITLAEKRVARQDTDMYMVLKRYVLAMIGMARIWYDHERDHQGFMFVDHKHPKVPAVDGTSTDDGSSSLSSLESSLSSDAGSVFSLNEAILRSMAPRPPRRQTGPLFKRLSVKAPHTLKNAQYNREDEFVLHSRMTRELVASPCELLLLRCCEVVQIGHNAQSELLIPPQIELAQIYEDLELYSRALLLVRRCLGILCSVYDYDHPWVIQLMQRSDRLKKLQDAQLRNAAATKIQATWRMHKAMQALADALGHPVKRHQWIPRKYRTTPDLDYLGDVPEGQPLGEDSAAPTEEAAADPRTWAVVPQTQHTPEVSLGNDDLRPDSSYEDAEQQPPEALVRYNPTEHREGGDTFTAMVPNANVIGTTQDTQTDTDVQHTEFGDVLTVRTTTVTKTITEDLAPSDDEEEEEEEPGEDNGALVAESPHKATPPQQQQQQRQQPQRCPPPPHNSSLYSDEEEDYDDYEDEEQPASSPFDTSTEAQQRRPSRRPMPPPPPPPRPAHGTKGTQVQPRGNSTATQTCTSQPTESCRSTATTESEKVSDAGSKVAAAAAPPPSAQRRPPPTPVTSPYSQDDIPRLAMHKKSAGNTKTPSTPSSKQKSPRRPTPPPSEPRQSSRPHSSAVMHNSKREPFRDLVEPNELYPLDTNGAPVFLPPLPYRAGLGPNGVPQPPTAESGQLVVHDPSRNRAMLLYDPRKIDPNAQPGMPMTLPSPANGYPRHANAPLVLPPPPKKVTRDHKIIKTRVTRTYRRGTGGADSENDTLDGEEDEDQVHEHESGSSWETSGSVSWEASSSGSSNNGDADGERGSTSDTGAAVAKISHVHRKKHENMSLKLNEAAALTKPCNDDDEGVKREGVNTSVAHHVKHSRRSKTTTTVCHVDDASEL